MAKQIPHSVEAEHGVIGSILLDQDTIHKVIDIINSSDFYVKENWIIFEAITELFLQKTPIDILTVREYLDDRQQLDVIWWNKTLIDLAESIFTSANIEQYARIVKQKSILRKFIKAGNDIFLSWYDEEADIEKLLEMVWNTYDKLSSISETDVKVTKIWSLLFDLQDDIEEAIEFWDKAQGYKTGIDTIDKYTWWIVKGRTMRLSAYSNTGKSALSYSIVNSVLRQWAKVLYFSLEIPKEDLRNRLLSNYYHIPIHNFDKKSSLKDFDMSEYAGKDLFISSEFFSMSDIERITKSLKPDIVFIDYVQLIKWEWNTEYEQMNDVARRIRKLTSDCNIWVFDLSQVANEGKEYKKGSVIPSKWSGELVSAANIVLVMQESKFPWKINIHIAKNRHWVKWKCFELIPNFQFSDFKDEGEIEPENKAF